MNNKLTIAGLVLAHVVAVLVLTTVGGCRTSGQYDRNSDRAAFSGFPRDGGYIAETTPMKPRSGAPVAQPVAEPVAKAEPVSEPVAQPVSEPTAEKPVSAKPATEVKTAGAGRTYTVKPNESLWIIAKREGVTVAALTEANGLKKNAVLKEGQKLVIPAASGEARTSAPRASGHASHAASKSSDDAVSGNTYVVRKGDSVSVIARRLGVTSAALRSENNLKGDAIREGQKLRVPAGGKVAATSPSAAAPAPKAAAAKPAAAPKAESSSAPVAAPVGGLKELAPMGGSAPAATPAPAPVAAEPVEAVSVSK